MPGSSGTCRTSSSVNRRFMSKLSGFREHSCICRAASCHGSNEKLVRHCATPLLGAAEHFHAGEDARGSRVSAANGLVGLSLAAVLRAVHLESALIAYRSQAPPERGG